MAVRASATVDMLAHRDEIHPHQASGAGRVEAEQRQHLGPLCGRQQVEHRLAAPTAAGRRRRRPRRRPASWRALQRSPRRCARRAAGSRDPRQAPRRRRPRVPGRRAPGQGSRSPPSWTPPQAGRRSAPASACAPARRSRAAVRCPHARSATRSRASRGTRSLRQRRPAHRAGRAAGPGGRGADATGAACPLPTAPIRPSSSCNRRSQARTRRAFATSIIRWPSTSALSSTSPSRRSKRRRSSLAVVRFSTSPSKGPTLLDRDEHLAFARQRHDNASDDRVVGAAQPDDHVGEPPEPLAGPCLRPAVRAGRTGAGLLTGNPRVWHSPIKAARSTVRQAPPTTPSIFLTSGPTSCQVVHGFCSARSRGRRSRDRP